MDERPRGVGKAQIRADGAFTRAVRREHEAIAVHVEAARLADASAERLEQALALEPDDGHREALRHRSDRERERAASARARAAAARKRLSDEGVPDA